MNKLFITLLICIAVICTQATNVINVAIWNNGTDVNIGTMDITAGVYAQMEITLTGFVYQPSILQSSTYNYVTNQLSLYALNLQKEPFLFIIDTNTWSILSKTPLYEEFQYGGLASTNTQQNNLFTTCSVGGYIYPSTIDPNTNAISKLDTVLGSYRGSVYLPKIESYLVLFKNQTGLFGKVYSETSSVVSEINFHFSGNPYPVNDAPLNLVYDSTNRNVLAQVYMTDSNGRPSYALAHLVWTPGYVPAALHLSRMTGYTGDIFLTTVLNNQRQQYAYSFADSFGQTTLYTFSTYTNNFVTFRPIFTKVLSAF
ncbi:hypothetical protein CYY_007470 [Polysphondylium violaceum]|uniref:Carbohydrate binding domain-containing protein n=1 Tax=Polysphondylium violaceum TaxID=133409 RepID=A0A8J4UY06_9MYCE|nr:hypothetical protein CYY_007470 [Polysphondylium violaceum]